MRKKKYVRTQPVFQMEAAECGAAALASILAWHGKNVPLERVRIETGISRDGCSAGNILEAAKSFGLLGHAYEMELAGLEDVSLPCIIHWNFNHFVVYEGRRGKYFYINDPDAGRRRLGEEEIDGCFTGIVLEFQKGDSYQAGEKDRKVRELVWRRVKEERKDILALAVAGVFLAFPGMLVPVMAQVFIDRILLEGQTGWLMPFTVVFSGFLLFQMFWMLYRGWVLRIFRNRMALHTSFEFLHHMFRLPMNFYEQRYAGDLSERVLDNHRVCEFLSGRLTQMVLDVFTACFYFSYMIFCSGKLALAGGLGVFLFVLFVMAGFRLIQDDMQRLRQDEGRLAGAVYAGISISRTIKASGAEEVYTRKVLGHYAKAMGQEQKIGKTQEMILTATGTIPEILLMLLLFLGSSLVIEGSLTVGGLTAFLSVFGAFLVPVMQAAEFVRQIQEFQVDILRMDDITSYEEEERFSGEEDAALKTDIGGGIQGGIEVKGISFGYHRLRAPFIKELSFAVESGGSIAFVGGSGSGKSTVAKMLSGLYQPWSGEIFIDGRRIQEVSRDALRAGIGIVSQEITLFSGTVRDNLTMWNPAVMESDMIQAAEDACIHDEIINKPGAYEYLIKENGNNLSGGQKQRIEIARALAKNPTVLILDEATSALDAVTEKKILDNIKRRGCTCIVIAHRLSAIRDCGQIIVMDKGVASASGTQEELVETSEIYRNLMKNE